MTIAWVIGRGGLLGSALARELARRGSGLFEHSDRFAWRQPELLHAQIERATQAFVQAAAAAGRWEVYWAAGVGTLMSAEGEFASETRALASLLDAIARHRIPHARSSVFTLASSAGAIYAGSRVSVIDEQTPVAPTGPYARAKLEHEAMVGRFASESGAGALIARISTLYGVGQSGAKAQGLLTHISRCIIRNRPIQIFVPLDTIRDYIFADDAAAMMVEAAMQGLEPGHTRVKIIASERSATIGEIVSVFKRVARRPPRIMTSATPSSSIYSRRIQFRSVVPPLTYARRRTPLLVGISRVMAAERALFVAPSSVGSRT